MSRGRVTAPKPAKNREGNLRLAFAAFRYCVQWSNCCRRAECRFTSVVGPRGGVGVVVGEPCSRPARVSRGPVSMNKTTHIASSSEASPWVETNPPVERVAPMPEDAPPPIGLLRGRTWGSASSGDDDAVSYATSGPNNPDWPEAHPQWAHGRDHPQGLDAAAWAAASPVGSRSLGALRSASTGDVEANYTSSGADDPDWLEADPWGTRLELDHPWGLDTAA